MKPLTLWPGGLWSDQTTFTLHPAQRPTAGEAGVLVLPGGGYRFCAAYEGIPVAKALGERGLHGAVLEYRHAPEHRHPAPIHDALRAIRVLRKQGWRRVAVLGFSAGGHLAATAAVHHDRWVCPEDDLAAAVSARPDVAVLCYAVVDMAGHASHAGCREALLGSNPDPELAHLLSLHEHVDGRMPPTFIWQTSDDPLVPLDNALLMAGACHRAGVSMELHAYESGPHGVGLADGTHDRPDDLSLKTWMDHAAAFLHRHLPD